VEGNGRELRVGADRSEQHRLRDAVHPALLDHVRAHHQIGVPVPPRVGPVRADPADLGREVHDELGLRVRIEPLHVPGHREVVVAPAGHERVETLIAQSCDQVGAEEASAAGDQDAHERSVPGKGYGTVRAGRSLL
jgi:hypothetical protein